MPHETARTYDRDLAYVHDVGFGSFARQSASGLLRILRRHRVSSGLVVDIGCGTGIWAEQLLGAGYDIVGIDLSPAMLKLARQRAPEAKFIRSSFVDAELPPCDAMTAMGEVLCYALDRRNTRANLRTMLRRAHSALRRGGVFIFDIAEPGRGSDLPAKLYWEGDDWALLREAVEDPKRRTLTRNMTIFRRIGGTYRRSRESHVLNLYPRDEVQFELERVGFTVTPLTAYGKQRFPQHLAGFIAVKKR